MSWLALGIAAYAAWAGVTIVDKIVLSKWIKFPTTYMLIYGFIQLITLAGLPFFGLRIPRVEQLLAALLVGALTFYGCVIYVKALSLEEASRVAPLFQFGPLFTLLMAYFLIGERLGHVEITAFAALVAGGILVSIRRAKGAVSLSPAFALMLAATLLFASSSALMKYVFTQQSFWDGFVLMRLGFFAGALSLLSTKGARRELFLTTRALPAKARNIVVGNSLVDVGAFVIWSYAVSLGPVSIIHALASVTPLLVFILALGFSVWAPRILREEVTLKTVLLKLFAMVLIVAGVAMLSVKQ